MIARRSLLRTSLGLAGGLALAPTLVGRALACAPPVRRLAFNHLHTGETLDVVYYEGGSYVPGALSAVNHVLRDWRNNETHEIEPRLLDLLSVLTGRLETRDAVNVICGYRSPATNAMLHDHSSQVASGSLHLRGQAIDLRIPGVATTHVRDAALALGLGGVGYYSVSDFVHVDIGRVRRWEGT
jgi:uncharacterized protein YcbK (DUF882 family)